MDGVSVSRVSQLLWLLHRKAQPAKSDAPHQYRLSVQPTSSKGSVFPPSRPTHILGFTLTFRYPSSLSRNTATCLSIIARLGPPTA
jgi:hypothetical protein